MTHFSLFTGIGGIDLAAEWAGFETVGQCEWADYPTKVLEKHWPGIPRWRDIRSVTADSFRERTGLSTVDLVSGGFPCQPFSIAGKRRGKGDDRYLWPEMLRVISEFKPTWVLGENVAGIVTMGESTSFSELEDDDIGSTTENMVLEEICQALGNIGYEVQPILIPACSVGAPHQRYRTFIVGHSKCEYAGRDNTGAGRRTRMEMDQDLVQNARWDKKEYIFNSPSDNVANANSDGCSERLSKSPKSRCITNEINIAFTENSNVSDTDVQRLSFTRQQPGIEEIPKRIRAQLSNWWAAEPNVGRVANGIPSRVDRLKCLGNAVVPQQVHPILAAIAEIERMHNA